jgi:cytochrome c-type biogenesis protein CcmH/NrfG
MNGVGRATIALLLLGGCAHQPAGPLSHGRSSFEAEYGAGVSALYEGRLTEAEHRLTDAMHENPGDVRGFVGLVDVYVEEKRFADAVRLARDYWNQNDPQIREALGVALYHTAKPPPAEALTLLEEAAARDQWRANLMLGLFFYTSDPERARPFLQAYLRLSARGTQSPVEERVRRMLDELQKRSH